MFARKPLPSVSRSHVWTINQSRNQSPNNITYNVSPPHSPRNISPSAPSANLLHHSIKKVPLVSSVALGNNGSSATLKTEPQKSSYIGNNQSTINKFPSPQSIYTNIPMMPLQRVKSADNLAYNQIIRKRNIYGYERDHVMEESFSKGEFERKEKEIINQKEREEFRDKEKRNTYKGRIQVTQKLEDPQHMKFNRAIPSPTFAVSGQIPKGYNEERQRYSSRPITQAQSNSKIIS